MLKRRMKQESTEFSNGKNATVAEAGAGGFGNESKEETAEVTEDLEKSQICKHFRKAEIHVSRSGSKQGSSKQGSRDGAVVRALASHQCIPGSIPDSASYVG